MFDALSPVSARRLLWDTVNDRGKRFHKDYFYRAFGPYFGFRGGTQIIAKAKVMKYSLPSSSPNNRKDGAQSLAAALLSALTTSDGTPYPPKRTWEIVF
jgi:hypothetical protein